MLPDCRRLLALSLLLLGVFSRVLAEEAKPAVRPNILWIVAEDASPHVGCYGEKAIATPHIDALAREGVRFTAAIVTAPVCSPSRSAMVTGMYQTTLGAHNHRSQVSRGKGRAHESYHASYRLPIRSIPELFRDAGYFVANRSLRGRGKTDYNFIPSDLYDDADWSKRANGQPFFAQVQLAGGKARNASVERPVDADEIQLPPYYPDVPAIRLDWARYLNSWTKVDREVGQLVERLRDEGVLEQTIIFFWTDHGVSHLRGKQFLYEEGIRVPLIVRFGDGRRAGLVREDLVEHIDVAAASLTLAGLEIPDYVQGRDIFAKSYTTREYAFSARDRCDETVDILRCVRTPRFKYIRNFLSYVSHAQPSQYKDGKEIIKTLRELHRAGKLTELQGRPFAPRRPPEELYDLEVDPYETVNLAKNPDFQAQTEKLRGVLYDWMVETNDVGLIPELILEELGRAAGNKYQVLTWKENSTLLRELIEVIEAGERRDRAKLLKALESKRASLRYWGATWLGVLGEPAARAALVARVRDSSEGVRVAVALALCQLGESATYLPALSAYLESDNYLAGMYAVRAYEQLGTRARPALPTIRDAQEHPYEFTRRFARRLTRNLEAAGE